jgi:hypothetical protein
MLILHFSHKTCFSQDLFGFSKNGQKKCPKLKTQNTFGKKNKVNIINSPKGLNPPLKKVEPNANPH